jgi:hypothetical protein
MSGDVWSSDFSRVFQLHSRLKAVLQNLSSIISYRFNRATSHRFLAGYEFDLIFGLFADKGISVLERAGEVLWSSLAADITVDAGRINIESAGCVFLNFVVWVWHESADYAGLVEYTNRSEAGKTHPCNLV